MSPQQQSSGGWSEPKATALLVLADGTVLEGVGLGATGSAVAEVCFNDLPVMKALGLYREEAFGENAGYQPVH